MATPLSQRVSLADLQALRFQAGPLADAAEALATLAGQSPGTDAHDEWPSKRRLLANVTRRSAQPSTYSCGSTIMPAYAAAHGCLSCNEVI